MKALIVASVASMIDQFTKNNIASLQSLGYEVTVATNFEECGTITAERCRELQRFLNENGVTIQQIDFKRSPLHLLALWKAVRRIKKMAKEENFNIVHCHSPIGALVTRLVFRKYRKKGVRIIYTAHGFHFYKGAPKTNWVLFYPIEKICAKWTDVLITINKEDYELAKAKFRSKVVEYIPGVGIDVDKFADTVIDKIEKRKEIDVPEDSLLLLSVGELNKNKNHQVVIKALAELGDRSIHYAIAGKGKMKKNLEELAGKLNVNLHLLGYRSDIAELYKAADVYVLPSIREGLNVSVMEAMASGLPCIVSEIRGNVDMVKNGENGYYIQPTDVQSVVVALKKINDKSLSPSRNIAAKYDASKINCDIMRLYTTGVE